MTLATSTVFAKPAEVRGDWFLIDAAGRVTPPAMNPKKGAEVY
jgi:hypothetical protein